jgi:hypothetical protein
VPTDMLLGIWWAAGFCMRDALSQPTRRRVALARRPRVRGHGAFVPPELTT